MKSVEQSCVAEWSWSTNREYGDPFNEVDVDVVFTDPRGEERRIPAFWSGGGTWRARYASPLVGTHHYRTICSDRTNRDLDGLQGSVRVVPYEGENPLLRHGPVRVAADGRHFEHADGTPFLWLGDTWWMALCERLKWPGDFETLTMDRQEKGFSVVLIAVGLYPPKQLDERSRNEAGWPWDKEYRQVNPAYFDLADRRIVRLVEAGLVPCIHACWGYVLAFMGMEKMQKHWRYLVARYSAYPVLWCLAGEAASTYQLNEWPGKKRTSAEGREELRKGWTELARYLRAIDGQHHPITIHPGRWGHKEVEDPSVLDYLMYQPGHGGWIELLFSPDAKDMFQPPNGGWTILSRTVDLVEEGLAVEPKMPVLIGEVNYEGMAGSCGDNIQRFHFWSCMLSGAAGHTYGANGVWQVSTREKRLGASQCGLTYEGDTWEIACQLPGSKQLGLGKRLLERYPWWEFEAHPEWVEPHESRQNRLLAYAAGVPGKVRVLFIPGHLGMLLFKGCVTIEKLERDVEYRGLYFNPRSGEEHEIGQVRGDDEGRYVLPGPGLLQDWVVVLERSRAET